MQVSGDSWKVMLPCTREEAQALAENDDLFPDLANPPVVMTREPDPAQPEQWVLETYFDRKPTVAQIRAVQVLVPSASRQKAVVEHLPADDWVTLSQSGLEPVRAGRFFVYTAAHADAVPADAIAFAIEAGQAFGTGQHETTTGCLEMLDGLKRTGARFANIIDVGTGTGLLAFAAARLWPHARVIASDIDHVAVQVAEENAAANGIPVGTRRGAVELVTAAGLAHPRLRRRAPYDLVIANILAGPLIDLAPVLSSAIKPGGSLILAGLLDHQAAAVAAAYRRQGMRLASRVDRAEWPTLRLVRRKQSVGAN